MPCPAAKHDSRGTKKTVEQLSACDEGETMQYDRPVTQQTAAAGWFDNDRRGQEDGDGASHAAELFSSLSPSHAFWLSLVFESRKAARAKRRTKKPLSVSRAGSTRLGSVRARVILSVTDRLHPCSPIPQKPRFPQPHRTYGIAESRRRESSQHAVSSRQRTRHMGWVSPPDPARKG
ncbi:hypothetical protein VTI74DRAFT_6399 [Chaetomium olivicolor]